MKKMILWLGLLFYIVLLCGCPVAWLFGGAASGIGAYDYLRGELERKYPVGFDKTWETSIRVLEQLQFTIPQGGTNRDGLAGSIEAQRADGTPIHITFGVISDKMTSIKLKIGMFGDREISERIHERIKVNLGLPK